MQVRHEETGALAAVMQAKFGGSIGVAVGSGGPGATHLINGIYEEKDLIFSLLAMLGLVCVGGWHFISQNQAQAVKAEAKKTFIQSSRPTIFFHGWGSSSRAERHMANAAKNAGVTQTIIEAKVAEDGQSL